MRSFTAFLLAAAALALAGCGGSNVEVTTTTAPKTTPRPGPTTTAGATSVGKTIPTLPGTPPRTTVLIEVGSKGVEGGPVHARLSKGQKVTLLVRSALGDEVHVHGYDLKADVPANGEMRIAFTASIAGRFEVELESRGLVIAELDVE